MSKRNRQKRIETRPTDRVENRPQNDGHFVTPVEQNARIDSDHAPTDQSSCQMSEETYVRERSCLIEIEQKSADQHDKAILTLTSGALGLSITFLDKFATNPLPETLWLVGASWSCFIVGIVSILASFLTSQAACRRQRDLLDSEYSTGTPPKQTNPPATATRWLNLLSYVLVVVGMAFLASFSWSNLAHKGDDAVKQQQDSKPDVAAQKNESRGAVPPKSPAAPKPLPANNTPQPNKK